MQTIRRFRDAADAAISQTLLVDSGISATLADDGVAALGPPFAPWGIRLQVPESDAERALQILGEAAKDNRAELDVTPLPGGPREHEVPPDNSEVQIVCPGCGAGWALSRDEAAIPTFLCPDCRATIPLKNALETPLNVPASTNSFWHRFLPRSDSKWVFIVVMIGYTFILAALWNGLTQPFLPPYTWSYAAYNWSNTLLRFLNGAVLSPVIETLILALIFETLRFFRVPAPIQIFLAALPLCALDGYKYYQHGIAVIPAFALMGVTYVYWRRISWKSAFLTVLCLHSLYNTTLYTRLLANQIHRDFVSSSLTGSAFALDRASRLYEQGSRLYESGKTAQAIAPLQQAIAIYPKDLNYYLYLGLAQRSEHQLAAAEANLRTAVSMDPDYWLSWDDLSFVLYDEKHYAEAMDDARRAVDSAPDDQRSGVYDWIKYMKPAITGTAQDAPPAVPHPSPNPTGSTAS